MAVDPSEDAAARPADPGKRIASLPCWRGPIDIEPLTGGITNTNFVVKDGGRRYVVRLGGDIPVHQISRANELAASRAAFEAGISPAVVHHEPGILVLDFVDGRTLGPDDIRDPAGYRRVVELVRRCHVDLPHHFRGPAPFFWVFQVLRDYAASLRDADSRHLPLLPDLLAEADDLATRIGPIDIVFGHNDLLASNFIDDGERLWLVDWDYAGFNSPLFDLGGLVSNSELDDDAAEAVLELYFGAPVTPGLRRRFHAMTAASLLRETMWSMVSEIHSTLDFDYGAYTAENLRRYRAALKRFPIS